jgi:threonylcarbamoyladenosine tRNA methylthiotransferase MtaB
MKRRHSRIDAIRFCDRVRKLRPHIALGADIIAGVPTETDAMFANTLSAIEACGLTFLHVFPFSARPETPAARMPKVRPEVVQERAARAREAGKAALSTWMESEVGRVRKVLLEGRGRGHTEHFAPVEIASGKRGEVISARITGFNAGRLSAVALQEAA